MIIIDIETTGIDRSYCGVLSIGAVQLYTQQMFYTVCRPPTSVLVSKEALAINGFNMSEIWDNEKIPSDKVAFDLFLKWAKELGDFTLGGQNIAAFDAMFLSKLHNGTFDMNWPFGRRFVDLHSVAYAVFGESLSIDEIAKKLGFEPEPKPHNALNGAKLEEKCFQKLFEMTR